MFNSLFKKTFAITFSILLISFFILYVLIYAVLPVYYVQYQSSNFDRKVQTMVSHLEEEDELTEASFTQFNSMQEISYRVYDENGYVMFMSDDFSHGVFIPNKIAIEPEDFKRGNQLTANSTFSVGDDEYTIYFSSRLDSVAGIRQVLYMIVPYMVLIGMILALLASYLFAKIISKPIIKLNRQALDIANLDFSHHHPMKRNDEIGKLSENIQMMADHLEEAMIKLQEDIEAANGRDQERKELMAILSHELKTPLTILSGQTECMIAGIGKYKDHDKYLRENLKEYARLNKLVTQILTVSKVENFDLKIDPVAFNIEKMIKERVVEYQNIFADKKLSYELDIEKFEFKADEKLMDFITKNIIENAFKYAKPESNIIIKLDKSKLSISNEIEGQLKRSTEELTNAFIQNDESRNTEGHGLGLYIVEKSIEQHGFTRDIRVINNRFIYDVNFK